jgi:thymidylate synthase (FAD)
MGTDALVINAARVSFSKEAENYTEDQNAKLIRYLASHNHFTPFTHPQVVLRERVPIFVARQRFKHVVGFSYNEVSRRYVDDKPEFYYPDVWRSRPEGSVKQGSGSNVVTSLDWFFDSSLKGAMGPDIKKSYNELIEHAARLYEVMVGNGVAPEQARMVLPQSMMTEYYVTGSLAAWARAYKLRIDGHAQKEIQDLAIEWDKIIRPLFPASWSALVD